MHVNFHMLISRRLNNHKDGQKRGCIGRNELKTMGYGDSGIFGMSKAQSLLGVMVFKSVSRKIDI
jgi:hypothetical protein